MSNTKKRSDNMPIKLQFGSGAKQTSVDEPQLAPNVDDVDDEFVFHNSAQIMRELRAKRASDPDANPVGPVQPDLPKDTNQPAASSTPSDDVSKGADEFTDNILDPDWDPEQPAPKSGEPEIPADDISEEVSDPSPIPPMPKSRPKINEFGYVLPPVQDQKPKRGWPAYAALAAGVVLAVSALGGAWYQTRSSDQQTTQIADAPREEALVETTTMTAQRVEPENTAEIAPKEQTNTARLAPVAPSVPPIDSVALALQALPARDQLGPTSEEVSPSPVQPGFVGLAQPDPSTFAGLPERPGPGQTVSADISGSDLPSRRSATTLAKPDLDTFGNANRLEQLPAQAPALDTQLAGIAPGPRNVLPGPLPKRATARPVLIAPSLPVSAQPGPAIASVETLAMSGPRTLASDANTPAPQTDQDPVRAQSARVAAAEKDQADIANDTRTALALPQTQTDVFGSPSEDTLLIPPNGSGDPLAQDRPPVRPADPEGPIHATLSTPILLAAPAQLIVQADPNGLDGGQSSYSAFDLTAPTTPRLADIAGAIASAPNILPNPESSFDRANPVQQLASIARQSNTAITPPVSAPVTSTAQLGVADLTSPIEGQIPTIDTTSARAIHRDVQGPDLQTASIAQDLGSFGERTSIGPGQVQVGANSPASPTESAHQFGSVADLATLPEIRPAGARPGIQIQGTPARIDTSALPSTNAQVSILAVPAPRPDDVIASIAFNARFSNWPAKPTQPIFAAPETAPTALPYDAAMNPLQVAIRRPSPLSTGSVSESPAYPARNFSVSAMQPPAAPQGNEIDTKPSRVTQSQVSFGINQVQTSGQPPMPQQTTPVDVSRDNQDQRPVVNQPERLAGLNPTSTLDPSGDQKKPTPTTALIFVQPAAENLPVSLPSEEVPLPAIVTSAVWNTDLDVELSDLSGAVTVISSGNAGAVWATQGNVVQAVNGVPVLGLDAWRAEISKLAKTSNNGRIAVSLDVRDQSGATITHTVNLKVSRRVALADGTIVDMQPSGKKWKAVVIQSTQVQSNALQMDDILLFDFTTRDKLITPTGFEALMAQLARQDATEVAFAIVRDGALENATLSLSSRLQ